MVRQSSILIGYSTLNIYQRSPKLAEMALLASNNLTTAKKLPIVGL